MFCFAMKASAQKRFTDANVCAQPLSMGLKYFMVQGSAKGSFSLVSGLGMFLVFLVLMNTLRL